MNTINLLIFITSGFFLAIFLLSKTYKQANKKTAYIRSGYGGERVLLNNGAFALPILHKIIAVNLTTQCLKISVKEETALLTQDLLKLDSTVDFYVRVPADEQHIRHVGQTLGKITTSKHALRRFLLGKFVNVFREISATMTMVEILQNQRSFTEKIHQRLEQELQKNSLLLESIAIQNISPTPIEYYQHNNQLDAKAKTRLAEDIADERKKLTDIEQKTIQEIKAKELELERLLLEMEQKKHRMRLDQKKQIDLCQAAIESDVAKDAMNKRHALNRAELNEQHAIELEKQVFEAELQNQKKQLVTSQSEVIKLEEIKKATRQNDIELMNQKRLTEQEVNHIKEIAKAQKDAVEIHAEAERIKSTSKLQAFELLTQAEQHKFTIEAEGIKQISTAIQTLTECGFPERFQDNLIAVISGLVNSRNDPVLRPTNVGNKLELISEHKDKPETNSKRDKLQALLKEANHTLTQELDIPVPIDNLDALANIPSQKATQKIGIQ